MHYRNGRPAANGDKIVMIDEAGRVVAHGVLFGATPEGGGQCNGNIALAQATPHYADLSRCLHVDDAGELILEGLSKR